MKIKLAGLAVVLLGLLLVYIGCTTTTSTAPSAGTGSVTAVVSVTDNFSPGTAASAVPSDAKASAITTNQRVSFTPSSMKIRIRGMHIGTQCVYTEEAGGLTIDPAGKEIQIVGAVSEIELIGRTAFGELYTFTTAEVSEDKFGSYRGVLLLYGDDPGPGEIYGSAEVVISGSLEVGGTTYSFTDLAVPMGTTGIGLNMPSSFLVTADSTAVVKMLFDVEYAAFLNKEGSSPQSALVPGTTDVYVTIDNLPFLPYAAAGDPTVERYNVTLEADTFGPPNDWYLRVVTFKDSGGELAAVQWYTVFKSGFSSGAAMDPGMLYIPTITKSGSSYAISEEASVSFTPAERRLAFPAFELASHSGTLNFGGTDYAYHAVKQ